MFQVEAFESAARSGLAPERASRSAKGQDIFEVLFASFLTSSDASRVRAREVAQFWRDQQRLSDAQAAEDPGDPEDDRPRAARHTSGESARSATSQDAVIGDARDSAVSAGAPTARGWEDSAGERPSPEAPAAPDARDRELREDAADRDMEPPSSSRNRVSESALDSRMPDEPGTAAPRQQPVRRSAAGPHQTVAPSAAVTGSPSVASRSSLAMSPDPLAALAAPRGMMPPSAQSSMLPLVGIAQPGIPGEGTTTSNAGLPQSVVAGAPTMPGVQAGSGGGGDTGANPGHEGARATAVQPGRVGSASSGTGADFQTLLNAAGARREAIQGARPDAASATPRPSTLRGVDMSQVRAVQELASVVRSNLGARHSTMMLQLDPPELGRVRIDVRMHDQVLTLRFEAHTQAGHDALASRLGDLRGALEQHGIQVQQVDVELRPPSAPAPEARDPNGQGSTQQSDRESGADTGDARQSGDRPHDEPGPSDPAESGGDAPESARIMTGDVHELERPAETGVNLVI